MKKRGIFAIGAGLGILSALSLSPKVQAALETGEETTGLQGLDESINILQQATGNNELRLTSTAKAALARAMENSDKLLLQDGIFTLSPSGEVKMIMKKSDLEKLKAELFKLKMEVLNAKNSVPSSST